MFIKCSRFLLLTLLVVIVFSSFPMVVNGSEQYQHLDILFLIDQSGSMSGLSSIPGLKPSDPLSLRFFGPRFAMQWLGSDRLFVHKETIFRMAVVHFGSIIEQGMDWQTISPNTPEAWDVLRAELENALEPGGLAYKSLGDTNFVLAFQEAQKYFERLNGTNDSQTNHRKIIVILTDGAPYVNSAGFSVASHMAQVQRIADTSFSAEKGYEIHVVAIQESEGNSWPRMQPYWDDITDGNAEQVHSNFEVGASFQAILQEVTADFPTSTEAVDQTVEPGLTYVRPFLQSITFTFFKSAMDQSYSILLPDNFPLTESDLVYEVMGEQGPIEILTIFNPKPGYWTIISPLNTQLIVKSRQVSASDFLFMPPGLSTKGIPVSIKFTLLGSDGLPVPSYGWPYSIDSTINWGNTSQSLSFHSGEDGRFTTDFTPISTGIHRLDIVVRSVDALNNSVELFGQSTEFDVGTLMVKSNKATILTELFEPIDVSYSLAKADGTPISDMPTNIHFEVGADETISWPLPLTMQSVGILTGDFVPSIPGNYKIRMFSDAEIATIEEFQVLSPIISLDEIPEVIPQYMNAEINVHIHNSEGGVLNLSSKYQVRVAGTIDGQTIAAKQIENTHYELAYRFTETGEHSLSILVEVVDANGQTVHTLAEKAGTFEVTPSQLLRLVPGTNKQVWRALQLGSPVLKVTPWKLDLYLQDMSGIPVRLTEVANVSSSELLRIASLSRDGEDMEVPSWNVNSLGNGHLQITGDADIEFGEYQVTLETNPVLISGFVWQDTRIVVPLKRVENPIVRFIQIAAVIVVIASMVWAMHLAGRRVIRYIRSKNPCVGILTVRDRDNRQLWSVELTPIQSNYIALKRKDLNPLTHLNRLTVRKDQKEPNSSSQLCLSLSLDTGKTVKSVLLLAGEKCELTPYELWLSYDGLSKSA